MNALDYALTEEEEAELPEVIREQRRAHMIAISEMETQHPFADDGKSVEEFMNAIVMRTILDEVTRRVILEPDKGAD